MDAWDNRPITGNYRDIQRFYEDDRAWTTIDAWHSYVDDRIAVLLMRICSDLNPRVIANVGSGGESYGIFPDRQLHLDLLLHRLIGKQAVVATAEQLPMRGASVDLAVSVGSVINHGNATAMLSEVGRILRPGCLAIIEFD